MKRKNILFSLVISFVINGVCLLINLISALILEKLPLAISVTGGDVITHIGFGITLDEFFNFVDLGSGVEKEIQLGFNFISFIISFIIIFLIVLIIRNIIMKKNNK